MKKPDVVEINSGFKEVNKVGTRREQWVNKARYIWC
jgi:hypothetical protein